MTHIQAVIFDLDDTLYPERDYAFSGFDAVAGSFVDVLGDPITSARQMRELFDTPHRRRVFDQLLAEQAPNAAAAELVPRMVDRFRTHTPTIQLPEESRRVLNELAQRYRLGLITDGPAVMQRAKLSALGLTEQPTSPLACSSLSHASPVRFDAIVVTDELGPGFAKPHKAAFELIAERLRVAHPSCVYVADNPAKDFVAPNALGWHTVRIRRPDGVYAGARTANAGHPKLTIGSLIELTSVLARLDGS